MLRPNYFLNQSGAGSGTINVTLPAGGTIISQESNVDSGVTGASTSTVIDPINSNGDNTQTAPVTPDTTQQAQSQQDVDKQQNTQTLQDVIIKIDGVEYKTDATGNALAQDGSIFMSKSKIDEFANTSVSLIEEVKKINNIILKDTTGNEIIYEDNAIGLAAREKDILSYGQNIGKQSAVNEFLESNPDVAEVYNYKQKYGTLEGYGVKIDYETIKFDNKNKDLMKQLVIESEITSGKTKEKAKQYADFLEANNTLEPEALESHKMLINKQVEERKTEQDKRQQYYNNYYGVVIENDKLKDLNIQGSLYDIIYKQNKINDIVIPKEGIAVKDNQGKVINLTGDKLFDMAAVAVNEKGDTQANLIISDFLKNPANELATLIYILRGGDLSDLVKREAAKQKILEINTQKVINSNRSNSSQSISINQGVRTPVK